MQGESRFRHRGLASDYNSSGAGQADPILIDPDPTYVRNRSGKTPGRIQQSWEFLPPLAASQAPASSSYWMNSKDAQDCSKYLELLFDIMIILCLSVFTKMNNVVDVPSGANFLSFYVIVFSMWYSQIHYDALFLKNTLLNRALKGCHLFCFLALASRCDGWDLQVVMYHKFEQPDNYDRAIQSMGTGMAGFGFLKFTGYFPVLLKDHAFKKQQHQWLRVAQNLLMMFCFVASLMLFAVGIFLARPVTQSSVDMIPNLSSRNQSLFAGFCLLWLVVVVLETIVLLFVIGRGPQMLSGRFSGLYLGLLGDGFIQVAEAYARHKFVPNIEHTFLGFIVQVVTLYCIWAILFGPLRDAEQVETWWIALLADCLEPVLIFAIILLTIGMVNYSILSGYVTTLGIVLPKFNGMTQAIRVSRSSSELENNFKELIIGTARMFNSIPELPSFDFQLERIKMALDSTGSRTANNDPLLMWLAYGGEMVTSLNIRFQFPLGNLEAFRKGLHDATSGSGVPDVDSYRNAQVQLRGLMSRNEVDMWNAIMYFEAACFAVLFLLWVRIVIRYNFGTRINVIAAFGYLMGLAGNVVWGGWALHQPNDPDFTNKIMKLNWQEHYKSIMWGPGAVMGCYFCAIHIPIVLNLMLHYRELGQLPGFLNTITGQGGLDPPLATATPSATQSPPHPRDS